MVEGLKNFNVINYQTRYGENCTATKKDGVVTIQGDKNGVRQMPLNDFMEVFLKEQPKIQLERTPQQDTVNFTGNQTIQENKKSNKTLWGLLGVGALALGALLLTRGRSGSKAVEEMAGKLGEEVTKPVIKETAKEATRVSETVVKASETVTRPVAPKASSKVTVDEVPLVIKRSAPKTPVAETVTTKAETPVTPKAQKAEAKTPKVETPKAEAPKTKTQPKEAKTPKEEAINVENKQKEATYDFAEQESQFSYTPEEVPFERRGSYGQDIYDTSDIRNEMDILSPHYKDPLLSDICGSDLLFNNSFGV
jgi:hypothetical protein